MCALKRDHLLMTSWLKNMMGVLRINDLYNSEDEKRSSYKMLKQIDKYRPSYPAAQQLVFLFLLGKSCFWKCLGLRIMN